jgi:hypothetical protein
MENPNQNATPVALNRLVRQVFLALDDDISDRCGIKHEWRKIDPHTKEFEIREEWEARILAALRLIEDSYALALAQHVPIAHWPDTIAAARKLMEDPDEWKRLGQPVPPAFDLPNSFIEPHAAFDPDKQHNPPKP